MKKTTLCYIERDGSWLMLHRNKKEHDPNEGKWIGVGGRIEAGETAHDCLKREVLEETGLTVMSAKLRGVIDFRSEIHEDEVMYLYTCSDFTGELIECSEGDLRWVPKDQVFTLPIWEGDKVFLNYLLSGSGFFHLCLSYDAEDRLVSDALIEPLVLASESPRRLELIRLLGIEPIVLPVYADETTDITDPAAFVEELSGRKARSAKEGLPEGVPIVAADTAVTLDGTILGKPATHSEAADMIRMLSGNTHSVYTGVTLICPDGREVTFHEKTSVRVAAMTEEEILAYAGTDEPMDKAGAYAIQGHFAPFIDGIDGDYSNVVGLPLPALRRAIRDNGALSRRI